MCEIKTGPGLIGAFIAQARGGVLLLYPYFIWGINRPEKLTC